MAHHARVRAISWLWFPALIVVVGLIFAGIHGLQSAIEPDELERDGEKWWRGGE